MAMYFVVFIAKTVEVSLGTVRVVLINRGEKLKGALIGFCEVVLWLLVVSDVLSNISADPVKIIIYGLGFASGNYLGVIIEGKLAIGTACIQAVVGGDRRQELTDCLRLRGFGVTVIQGEGMEHTVYVLMIYLKRKCVPEAIGLIREYRPTAMITVNDVRQLRNGFIRK